MRDIFRSARLAMQPQAASDADALFEAYGDVDLMRFWSSRPHVDVGESRRYLAPRMEHESWRGWTMRRSADAAVVGTLAMHEHRPGVAEIGYLVIRRFWGQGYAREGVARLIDLLFDEGRYRRVMADTDPDNDRSNQLLEQLGFRCEGRLRGEWETHIGVRDSLIWGLMAPEWAARSSMASEPRVAAIR